MPRTSNNLTNKNLILDSRNLKIIPKTNISKSKIKTERCILSKFDSSLNPEIIIKNTLGFWHLKWCSKTKLWYEIYDNDKLSISGYQIKNLDNYTKNKGDEIKIKQEKIIQKNKNKESKKLKINNFFDDPKIVTIDNFEILKPGTILKVFHVNNINKHLQYQVVELFNDEIGTLIKLNYNGYILHLLYNSIGKNWIQLDINNNFKKTKNLYYLKILDSNLDILFNIAKKNLTNNT